MQVERQRRILQPRGAVGSQRRQIDVAPGGVGRHLVEKQIDDRIGAGTDSVGGLDQVRCDGRDIDRAEHGAVVKELQGRLQRGGHGGQCKRGAHGDLRSRRRYSPRSGDLRADFGLAGCSGRGGAASTSMRPM